MAVVRATVSNPTYLPSTLSVSGVIASGASLSEVFDLGQHRLWAIQMPAAWTAAGLTFQASLDGINYFNLFDNNNVEVTWTVAAAQFQYELFPAKWLAIRWLKIRSGTSGAPVNQAAERVLTVVAVP